MPGGGSLEQCLATALTASPMHPASPPALHCSPTSKQDAYFVGQMYPRLAAKLVDPNGDAVLTQSRCNAFESIESRLFYTSNTRKVCAVPWRACLWRACGSWCGPGAGRSTA